MSDFGSFVPMILDGAGASWQMGAQHIGTKNVTDMYVMPYTYGAPSGNVGMYSGFYAGAGSKKTFRGRETYTKLGKTMNTIGAIHNVAAGDVSGLDEVFGDPNKDRWNIYQQWAGDQSGFVQGKDGMMVKSPGGGGSGILGARRISGPSHERGGVDLNLNGMPVEAEGGEMLFELSDGSKVVLNKEQQARLKAGEPMESIMKDLPKYSPEAAEGTTIPPWLYQDTDENGFPVIRMYDPSIGGFHRIAKEYVHYPKIAQPTLLNKPYSVELKPGFQPKIDVGKLEGYVPGLVSTGMPFDRQAYTAGKALENTPDLPEEENVPDDWNTAKAARKYQRGKFEYTPGSMKSNDPRKKEITSRTTGWSADQYLYDFEQEMNKNKKWSDGTPETEKTLIDQYNDNLKTSAILSGGNALNQSIRAGVDMIKNKRKLKPPKVGPVGYNPIRPVLENPQPYIDAALMGHAGRTRVAREAGVLPAELAMLGTAFPESLERIYEGVSKTNTGRVLGAEELNSRNFLNVANINAGIAQRNIALDLEDDKIRTEVNARSADVINKAMSRGYGLFGEYSQNKLYSDIIASIYGGGSRDALLAMMHANKYTDTPYAYPEDDVYYKKDESGNYVPVTK